MSKKEKSTAASKDDNTIIIRLWPKTPVLYPMAILALVCGIVGQIYGIPEELKHHRPARAAEVQAVNKGEVEEIVIPNVETSDPVPTPAPSIVPDPAPEPAVPENSTEPEATPPAEPATTPEVVPMAIKSADVDTDNSGLVQTVLSLLFLSMLAFSLFVVCIDFEVRWSLVILVVILMIIMGALTADKLGYITLPDALSILDKFILYATPLFYYGVFGIWVLLMIVSAIIARFHYVRIESNEVVVVSGVLESQKRMSTFRMHYTKEIQDVFEYYLPFVRSGRLVFTFPNEEHPLIMDNVLGINSVLKKLDRSSSSFQVRGVE